MITFIVLLLGLGVLAAWASSRPPHPGPKPRAVSPRPVSTRPPERHLPDTSDVVGGWLLGHQIAHGHDGFPGDPLPGGHLGSPANLAFWGSVFDEDDED